MTDKRTDFARMQRLLSVAREDYPDCVFCGKKTKWLSADDAEELFVFSCGCGQSVEVRRVESKDEELLRDPRSGAYRHPA